MCRIRAVVLALLSSGFAEMTAGAQPPPETPVAGEQPRPARHVVPLPERDLFDPLVADPKQPQFRVSWLATRSELRETSVGAVAYGENFGLVRWSRDDSRSGWQLNLAGAVFAQFDLQTESFDLMNADYVIGLPLTWRRGRHSARLRLYHQSSHLGDEYLLNNPVQRLNIQWEALEALVSRELGEARVYGGGEYMLHREPALRRGAWHGGIEYRRGTPLRRFGELGAARLVAAADAKGWEEHEWRPGWSLKGGVEASPLRAPPHVGRRWSLLLELYDGPSPYGQFHTFDVSYAGAGLYFMF